MQKSKQDKTQLIALGQRVKELRLKNNMTQEEMAAKNTLHRTYICDIERGARNPTFLCLKKLADALAVPVTELIQ